MRQTLKCLTKKPFKKFIFNDSFKKEYTIEMLRADTELRENAWDSLIRIKQRFSRVGQGACPPKQYLKKNFVYFSILWKYFQ